MRKNGCVSHRPYSRRLLAAAPVLLVAILSGCSQQPTADDAVVATAGDRDISAGLFAAYTQQTARGAPEKLDATYRERLLKELVQVTVAAEAEAKLGDKSTAYAVELQRLEMLAKVGAKRAGVFDQPDEAAVQKVYADFVRSSPAAELRVSHILVPTEAMAVGVIRKLMGGADFAALAKAESADESRLRGGEVGWVRTGTLPKPFMDAAAALTPGQYTTQPVKTPYGWHVIRLLETRTVSAPPLSSVRAQLVANLQQAKYEEFLRAAK